MIVISHADQGYNHVIERASEITLRKQTSSRLKSIYVIVVEAMPNQQKLALDLLAKVCFG